MLLFLLIHPGLALLKIGHLENNRFERRVLKACFSKDEVEFVSLPSCQHFSGVENAATLRYQHGIHAFIGAACDEEAGTISLLAERWFLPFFSSISIPFSSRGNSTIVVDTKPPSSLSHLIRGITTSEGWTQVGIMFTPDYSQEVDKTVSLLSDKSELTIVTGSLLDETSSLIILQNSRVVFILSSRDHFYKWLPSAPFPSHNEHILFFIDHDDLSIRSFFHGSFDALQRSELRKPTLLLKNMFLVQIDQSDRKRISEIAFRHKFQMDRDTDSSLLLCDAIQLLLSYPNLTSFNGDFPWLTEVNFSGYSGEMFLDRTATRHPSFSIHRVVNGRPVMVATMTPSIDYNSSLNEEWTYSLSPSSAFNGLPPFRPPCDFDGSSCSHTHMFIISVIICCAITVPLTIAWHLQRKEHELQRMPWRIAFEDIKNEEENRRHLSNTSISMRSLSCVGSSLQGDIQRGTIRGTKVTMRSFMQKKAITFTRKDMEILNILKNTTHPNLNTFEGISFNQNGEFIVCWSFAIRQSLEHVLAKSEHSIGRNFRSSFIRHILKGLSYIHSSSIRVHGSLFLTNCVVDSYWVVKLTDFGLQKIINQKLETKDIYHFPPFCFDELPIKYCQVAPEILREMQKTGEKSLGTQQGDIYQLGMLMYHILMNKAPYDDKEEDPLSLMKKLMNPPEKVVLHPSFSDDCGLTLRLQSIVQQCWQMKDVTRPSLAKIVDAVQREFGHDGKGTLVDQMIAMIDEYSANLEQIVEKRTREIEELNEKTERLLYQIMPRSIAEELREGRAVRPSMHPSVSVLFADVCQFTALCEQSIPVQIITMLNLLYSNFDSIIEQFSAFKVENVGDAYLIVSGIPELEDQAHLCEVCYIALRFERYVNEEYIVPHRADHKLKIKIGIHTGALASGILGSTAPRFCVFGDTVNVASRMGSTSDPGRIQMSETAASLIKRKFENRFIIQERGIVNVKGKGPCTTYWLIKEGRES